MAGRPRCTEKAPAQQLQWAGEAEGGGEVLLLSELLGSPCQSEEAGLAWGDSPDSGERTLLRGLPLLPGLCTLLLALSIPSGSRKEPPGGP